MTEEEETVRRMVEDKCSFREIGEAIGKPRSTATRIATRLGLKKGYCVRKPRPLLPFSRPIVTHYFRERTRMYTLITEEEISQLFKGQRFQDMKRRVVRC